MGFGDFLRSKKEKHGGVGGLLKAAISKPVRVATGNRGTRSSEPDPERDFTKVKEALANLPTTPDSQGRTAVAPSEMVVDGRPGTFNIGPDAVAVYRYQDQLYAIDSACTHEDGPLGESDVAEGGVITCPYHDWRFRLSDGECLSAENRSVSCYAIAEHDGFIWIGGRTSQGSAERGGLHDDGLVMDDPNAGSS